MIRGIVRRLLDHPGWGINKERVKERIKETDEEEEEKLQGGFCGPNILDLVKEIRDHLDNHKG